MIKKIQVWVCFLTIMLLASDKIEMDSHSPPLLDDIWISVVAPYLEIMDGFHFYCTNKKYYCHYDKYFYAWFKENSETLQYFLGKQETSRCICPKLDHQCEFIVTFPSANQNPDTITGPVEAYQFEFEITVRFQTYQSPITKKDDSESKHESVDLQEPASLKRQRRCKLVRQHKFWEDTLIKVNITSKGNVTYLLAYGDIIAVQDTGLKLHWKKEKDRFEVYDGTGHYFGFIKNCPFEPRMFATFSGCYPHKFPDSVQIKFPDCPFYKKQNN